MIVVGALVGTLTYSDVANAVKLESMKHHHKHHKKDHANVQHKDEQQTAPEAKEETGAGQVTAEEKQGLEK